MFEISLNWDSVLMVIVERNDVNFLLMVMENMETVVNVVIGILNMISDVVGLVVEPTVYRAVMGNIVAVMEVVVRNIAEGGTAVVVASQDTLDLPHRYPLIDSEQLTVD